MKNLKLTRRASRPINFLEDQILNESNASTALCAIDRITDDFYLLLKNKLYKISSPYVKDPTSYDINENLELVGLEYCSVTHELFAASKHGDIITISMEPKFGFEVMFQLNVDLQCMKLSPDHEMIILITVDGIVITMVSTFHVISEVDLYAPDFGTKQFITVGWGRKETQFHGSEGKKAAVAQPVKISQNEQDDESYRITWREDGSLFAVGFLHLEHKVRQFKVFNRDGILQYASELANGLEESLSWKPSGSLIATPQTLPNKHVVALFEKNGLKHREFLLPFKPNEIRVKDLFWSPDSEILTIWCIAQEDLSSILQLWTENNCHWYLKQTIRFPKDNSLIYATWSTMFSYKRLIMLTSKELVACDYNWCINHSIGKTIHDKSVVGVIDGYKLLMTGLRIGIIPPPMAHTILETPEPVNAIVFAPDVENENTWFDSNTLFCISESNKLIFYKHTVESQMLDYKCIGSYNIEWNNPSMEYQNSFYNVHNFCWLNKNKVLCSLSVNDRSFLCTLSLRGVDDQANGRVVAEELLPMNDLILHIVPSSNSRRAYIFTERYAAMYSEVSELLTINVQFPQHINTVEVVNVDGKEIVLSLSYGNCFCINGKETANNITSFFVHSDFLLLTTLQHTLICVKINEEDFLELIRHNLTVKPWENLNNEKSFTELNVRRVERGSQLIAAIPRDSKTILQMPRGNLECIQPRALSLYIVGYYLDNCDYLAAFDLMRRQRINLNLIYDHNPNKFIENAETFVEQVSKPSWLSLFLTELGEECITTTIYANYYKNPNQANAGNVATNKVELVCDLMRNIMENKNTGNYLIQPILISLVKDRRRQGLEGALSKIREIRKSEDAAKNVECITSDEALKYLLYIVDVNTLFDTALGMYDFDLAMFIASRSQKDPKEYIPFLNDMRELDENYMKYSIDLHLKRYESALEHLAREPNRFDECVNLIRDQDLYTKALKLFKKDNAKYTEIARMCGEFLLKKRHYQEAGIMFHRSKDLKEALNAYKLAGSWQDVIVLSTEMKLSLTEKRALYKELSDRLKSDKRYEEAANICINYLEDEEETAVCLCNGKRWKDAVRIAHDRERLDLIESHVKVSVFDYADHLMSQIEKNRQDFEHYKSRLAVVRANIPERNAQSCAGVISDNDSVYDGGISDLGSDTTSIASTTASQRSRLSSLSGKSYRSSKNRRKHERKLLSLKKGSAFEDLALIQALYQIINSIYKEKDELRGLVQMLVYFDRDEYANKLQNTMEQFLHTIERSKPEIWDKSAPSSFPEMENAELATQFQGLSASYKLLEPYITRPPVTNASPWKLNIF
ncbi:elongator complex protein 1 isoform X1 [Halictus rubicundus]|uniref:elongator complex protein 1 isoform X1 n=2 Tax=Halictus rubicundus TaxID=77578 RepID=UPI0040367538